MEYTAEQIWSMILDVCESRLSQQTISTWLTSSRAVSLLENGLTVELKNKFTAYYVEQNYQEILDQVASTVLERPFKINFIYRQEGKQMDLWDLSENGGDRAVRLKEPEKETADSQDLSGPKKRARTPRRESRLKGSLNPRYTFENFVAGRNSQFAHAAALSVADSPAKRYNPLFIYGGVGLGKTHLMQAIGNALLNNSKLSKLKICYISAEEFLNELVSAITSGSNLEFRNYYRQMDVLLIDDVEFLAKKERTQEEFFHTFNTLYESQKQIVLTSDRSPREIHHLEERMRSRFQWGLVADIQPPEFETRIAILKKKSEINNIIIPEKVLELIAEKITSNVRLLEGSLHYLKHYSDTQKTDINLELAEIVLKNIFDQKIKHIGFEDILNVVSDIYGMPGKAILSFKRKQSFVEPRQIAMYLCNKLTKYSLNEIADSFKRKDHTTVLHACRKIAKRCEEDTEFKATVESIVARLRDKNMGL
ncbi:MAG TPA: chromosomal replication initiator protein DnaA [archaeon]|nr:chromosomal replication initiator protein DnaA [archaeon]